VARQAALLEAGGRVVQETRLWNADRAETVSMRSKEEARDYRYFPEPDLPPLLVGAAWVEEVRTSLPELPADKRRRFVAEYGLPDYDAGVLTLSREVADYYEAVARESGNAKAASNWVMTEVLRKVKQEELGAAPPVPPAHLAHMIRLIDTGTISGKTAKDVFEKMWQTGDPPELIVKRDGLVQVSDEAAIRAAIAAVMARGTDQVAAYRKGKTGTLGWFVGQVMMEMGGKANPQVVNGLLKEALSKED
jgi:aspartyl-tRNA(Asn)/glutamyl-tRNA(Gln) amidotransferase subunit B